MIACGPNRTRTGISSLGGCCSFLLNYRTLTTELRIKICPIFTDRAVNFETIKLN